MENIAKIMRVLMKEVPYSAYLTDLEGKFVMVNDAKAARNNASIDEMIGKNDFYFMLRKEEAELSCKDNQQVIETGEPIKDKIRKMTKQDGTEYWVSDTKVPLRNEEGEIIGVFGITIDVTERLEAEKFKLHFVSMAGHDIRSPLAAMGAIEKFLIGGSYGSMDESVRSTIKDLYHRNRNIEKIANDYLYKASLINAEIPKKEMIDLRQDVIDPILLEEFSEEIEERHILIDNRLGSIPVNRVIISADKIWLMTVYRTLFSNSIRNAGYDGKISFGLEDYSDYIVLNVWDDGKGVPEEQRDKLFKPLESSSGSTGVSLAISYELIKKHGGEMWYENTYHDHPNFKFSLPKK